MMYRWIFVFAMVSSLTTAWVSPALADGFAADLAFREKLEKMASEYHLDKSYVEEFLKWAKHFEVAGEREKGRTDCQKQQLLDFFCFFSGLHPVDRGVYFLWVEIFANYRTEFSTLEEWLNAIRSLDRIFLKTNSIVDPYLPWPDYSWSKEVGHYYRYFLHLKQLTALPPWSEFQEELWDMQKWFSKEERSPEEIPLFLWEGRFYSEAKDELDKLKKKILDEPIRFNYVDEGRDLKIESTFPVHKHPSRVADKVLAADPKELFELFFPWPVKEGSLRSYTDEEGRTMLSVTVKDIDGDEFVLDFVVYSEREDARRGALYFTLEPPTVSMLNSVLSLWEMKCKVTPHEKFGDISVISITSLTTVRRWAQSFKGRLTRGGQTKEILDRELPGRLRAFREYLLKE